MKSREESPEEGTSPEKKSFSVKKSVKCTTIFKDKLTEQEDVGEEDDNFSPAVFVTNGALFEAKLCRPAAQRTGTQERCRELDTQEGIVTRALQLRPDSCQCPNYLVYNSLVMPTVCNSCDTAMP